MALPQNQMVQRRSHAGQKYFLPLRVLFQRVPLEVKRGELFWNILVFTLSRNDLFDFFGFVLEVVIGEFQAADFVVLDQKSE